MKDFTDWLNALNRVLLGDKQLQKYRLLLMKQDFWRHYCADEFTPLQAVSNFKKQTYYKSILGIQI